MLDENQTARRTGADSSPGANARSAVSSRFEKFERRQSELWWLTRGVLLLLALAYAWTSWDSVRSLAHGFEKLPVFLVLLIILFGLYTWRKTQELSEMRGLMRGLEQRVEAPSEKQP